MFATCWSVKGGSGTTVVAASLAVVLARRHGAGCLLVDLAGDLPAVLGMPEPEGPGIAGWLAAGPAVPADGLARLEQPVVDRLALVARGEGPLGPAERAEVLAALLGADGRAVVVDAGVPDGSGADPARAVLAAAATRSLLVVRPCYLALRRAAGAHIHPSGVVLVSEAGRALGRRDVSDVLGLDVVAEVPVDPAVARAVDAGLLATRRPRALERALGSAA